MELKDVKLTGNTEDDNFTIHAVYMTNLKLISEMVLVNTSPLKKDM